VLCNDDGGAIDDLAVYRLGEGRYLLVVNAARLDTDRAWIEARRAALAMDVDIEDRTSQQAMVAVQGPSAERVVVDLAGEAAARLGFFRCRVVPGAAGDWIVSRSGYTGEDGFEIICPAEDAPDLWSRASQAGAAPVGLAARDTLRLEAGLCLYGHELTEEITPLEAGLGWTLALDKESEFPGRDALRRQRDRGVRRLLVGLRLRSRGIPRSGQPLHVDGTEVGVVTSGTHSPMLESGIAMGYVAQGCQRLGATIEIAIRQRHVEAEVVGLPFVESRVRRTRKKRVGDPPRRQRT
jgi:aminomethyltransferase